jgi:hypothetical protein
LEVGQGGRIFVKKENMKIRIWCLCFFLTACGNAERVENTTEVKEQIEAHKLKRVIPAQIVETAYRWGKSSAGVLDKNLAEMLGEKIKTLPLTEAAAFCRTEKIPGLDSLRQFSQATFHRLPLRGKINTTLLPKEAEMLDAYRYNAEKHLKLEENVQKSGDTLLIYTFGIELKQTCLPCHGKPGTDINEKDLASLRKKFPAIDSLSGYAINQPVGIWSFLFPKKRIILKAK